MKIPTKNTYTPTHILSLVIFFAFFSFPTSAFAQLDQRCWTEKDCTAARQAINLTMSYEEANKGFVQDSSTIAACGKSREINLQNVELGFCSPIGAATTKASFGGKTSFQDFGQFIQYIYQYGIMAAGILAVLFIIIAGVQWILSGGNTTAIDSARKRIGNAVTGLFLAVISYTLLNQINPYLVNLRLPQVWLINRFEVATSSCSSVTLPQQVAKWGKEGEILNDTQRKEKFNAVEAFDVEGATAECGNQYFVENTPALSCTGYACKKDFVCLRTDIQQPSRCTQGKMSGLITGTDDFLKGRSGEYVDGVMKLVAVCPNGRTALAGQNASVNIVANASMQYYLFRSAPPAGSGIILCGSVFSQFSEDTPDVLGYYLEADINDESGMIRQGADDFFAIGRSPAEKNVCNINLSKTMFGAAGKSVNCTSDTNDDNCGCEGVADLLADAEPEDRKVYIEEIRKYLITQEEIDNGFYCNIRVDRSEFPDMDAATHENECSSNILNE